MNKPILAQLLAGAAVLLAGPAAAQVPALPQADLILRNGQAYLPDGKFASAIAIGKGVILAVGADAAVDAVKGPSTKVIDLKGGTVLPGLHDMHIHALGGGQGLGECRLVYGSSPDQIRTQVQACAATRKPGEWILGRGWANAVFEGKVQDKTLLDQAAPNNPVILQDETGHSSWANSMAMKLAGVTRTIKDPLNGIIEHDPKGEPNGLFREAAAGLIRKVIPPYTEAQNAEAMKRAYDHVLGFGITSLQDASANKATLTAQAALADDGYAAPRVKSCLRWTYNITGVDEPFEALYASRNFYRRAKVAPDCVKFGLDGVPGDGQTAAMLEPYVKPLSEERKLGILTVPPEVMKKMVTRFDRDGLSTLMHCTGDRCARVAVDAVEAARAANGYSGILHQIGHSNFTTSQDLKRGRALGATFEYSAYLYYWNAQTKTYFNAIGPERFERYKPLRETIDFGALPLEGSDWPVSYSANPWIAIETLVTREKPGGGGEKLAPSQMITLKEAIDIYTVNGARQFGHANTLGQIKPGYIADLVVIDRNIFKVPITQVHDTKAVMTFIDGKLVYEAK
jgi:predicted amidohydrolase YtcJ